MGSLKELSDFIDYVSDAEYQITLRDHYDNNSIKSTDLVILACKYNKVEILKYLLGNDSKIPNKLSIGSRKIIILPNDKDETCHYAFYYAIHSANVDLLDTLINKRPNNYFAVHLNELDEILSRAYEELKLKNVPLSEEMQIFVENKLINLRFFSNILEQHQNIKDGFNNIRKRIELVLQNIGLLKAEYSTTEQVNEKFLFITKFIAQNIHILKRQLGSTYNRLPWEEMEFCLVRFVSSHTKRQEIDLFYRVIFNKSKILKHLENFAKGLENEKNIIRDANISDTRKLAKLPKFKRDEIVAKIINNYPQFEELYNDYQQIRDIHSLQKINDYIQLASSANPKEKEGQLIITRVLQVIGEYLKNTLESPKLSNTTSELLLLSLPKDIRKVITDLRNSLSHAYSLSKRTEIEKNTNFLIGVQNDIKRIGDMINNILHNNKIKTVRILLKKIIDSENLNEIKEVAEAFSNVELNVITSGNFITLEHEKLEKLIEELSNSITEKTNREQELFHKILNIINSAKTKSQNIEIDYSIGFEFLNSLNNCLNDNKIDHNIIKGMKLRASKILENIAPRIESYDIKKIAEISMKISHSIISKIQVNNLDKVNNIICEIFHIAEFETRDIIWMKDFRQRLKDSSLSAKKGKHYNITEEEYNKQLNLKLSELENILKNNELYDKLIENLPSYKNNRKLQAVVEMLVLDIMSILDSSKNYLESNLFFLDDNTPLLTGKSLRNHLAHDNALIDILLSDPLIATILNAKKLTSENITRNKKRIGKLLTNNPSKLKDKYNQDLITITNQERMFVALEEGNLEDFKSYLKKGADINARSIKSWTALHFAAKGSNLDVMKLVLNRNLNINVKDINGQSPLHVAAAYARESIVKFFVEEMGLYIDDKDKYGKTPLHIAAQKGHKDIVEILLKNKASTVILDKGRASPLYYAIRNNYIDIAKILLEKDRNIDINEAMNNFTPLHEAAERGHVELVYFLLQNKADVNVKNDRHWTPLHAAALNGHVEIVNALIMKGANVNASVVNGYTSLHYAAEDGHEKIVNILLKHGANVNAVGKTDNITPLHIAIKVGHERIVMTLLKHKANINISTVANATPLHLAAHGGYLEIVVALLKYGVDIHAKVKNNATPLHYAAENGHKEVAELLIKNRAEINARNNNNVTPLHIAALKGHKDMTDFLIRNRARVDVQDIEGRTPLHIAAMNGNKNVIDLLIKHKAEIDVRNNNDMTPLHFAAANGHKDAIVSLIKNKAEVNAKTNFYVTPLHAAVTEGYKDVVNLLIENKAELNSRDISNNTPLHLAVEAGNKEIVEVLIANGANVNDKGSNKTPLFFAVKYNYKEIVEVLIANGADVKTEDDESLLVAVLAGYRDIVEILLRNKAYVNIKDLENVTPLHLAVRGVVNKEIVNALITRGADVGAVTIDNITPLHLAAEEGHEEIVELLITSGANVDAKSNEDVTPLHMAAIHGHSNVVKVLLDNKANINVEDGKNRTSLELAVLHGHLQVVKMLLQYKKVDMNTKGNDDWTILHIASQVGNLEMVKYLIDEGSDINAKSTSGSEPIHIAAREGYEDIVDFFLSKGLNINDLDATNQTLLHYAAMKGRLQVVKYLITQSADVNAKDGNGLTPMHAAASAGYKNVIEILLRNGAFYNAVDNLHRKPIEIAINKDVINLLASTKKLFEAVRRNNSSEVENHIKAGAFVNAKNAHGTPLHYAAWKGYDGAVNILLQNKANPNVADNKGFAPLHYAAKFSHLKVVKTLLSNGAVYNAVSGNGKTSSDFTVDGSIISLFKLISESFRKIKNGNVRLVNELNKIKDIDTVKAIMCARNEENETLVVAAMHNKFSKVEQLKQVSQGDISVQINIAIQFVNQNNYQEALSIFRSAFKKRKEILGSDNPGTLDIQEHIAQVLYVQGNYQEALNICEEIFQKQKEVLGSDDKSTLRTRGRMALVLHRQEKNEEAFNIYQEVYQKQKELLGAHHSDTLDTQFHMALVLDRQGKYEKALNINRAVFEKKKEILGANHLFTIRAQNNIAMVLDNQGKHEEALTIYKEVFEKKKAILGVNHHDTVRTLHHIAEVLSHQKKYYEASKTYEEVLNIKKNVLGPNHPETLNTQYDMANIFFAQGKWVDALKAYKKIFGQMKAVYGQVHPKFLYVLKMIEMFDVIYKSMGSGISNLLQQLQKDINIAASNGDTQTVQRLLKDGADINDKDIDGRTPLHYAISKGHVDVMNILLKNGADVTQVTNKGNTPLHTAAFKGYKEIIEVLLQHVSRDKLSDFINAKTTICGATSLHIAAKNGSLDVTMSLLKRGAMYNVKNNEGKIPLELSNDQNIDNLLRLVEELFRDANKGNIQIINKLGAVKLNEFVAVINARNNHGNTLLQVAITNKHKNIANKLLEMLRKANQNLQ